MAKPLATYQKLRGGYYTPKVIADFLAGWAIQSPTARVLEPSCGDGVLLESAANALLKCGASNKTIARLIHGVEIDEQEARRAVERIRALNIPVTASLVHQGDFFAYCQNHLADKQRFDAVIGNPPFIRYQTFLEDQRQIAFDLMRRAGLHPSRLTNAWLPFFVASTLLLNQRGRLAMVIPAELLQVNYAAELRYFISEYYDQVTLITFKKLLFDRIQQEVVLLLGERHSSGQTGIRTIELNEAADLLAFEHTRFSGQQLKPMDHSIEKWTQYFLDASEIALLRELRANLKLTRAGDVLEVDVGIVTGLNEFFVLTGQQVAAWSLMSAVRPIVSRSGHLQGMIFTEADWQANAASQLPAFLLNPPDAALEDLPVSIKDYVISGEEKGFHQGYKCRIRKRWYIVPSVWTPDAFMLRQVHGFPKIIFNETPATCTDTIHRVKFRRGVDGRQIAKAFLNSLTFAFAEVTGRSYGGGVLELEPREAERLPLPLVGAERLDIDQLNQLLLAGHIAEVLKITDQILLVEGLGLSRRDAQRLREMWQKLRDRRISRK